MAHAGALLAGGVSSGLSAMDSYVEDGGPAPSLRSRYKRRAAASASSRVAYVGTAEFSASSSTSLASLRRTFLALSRVNPDIRRDDQARGLVTISRYGGRGI